MGVAAFLHDKVDADGTPLYWSARTGYPIKGKQNAPHVHDPNFLSDIEQDKAQLVYDPYYKCFKLPQDTKEYLAVIKLIMGGRCGILEEKKIPDPADPSNIFCHVWWYDISTYIPPVWPPQPNY